MEKHSGKKEFSIMILDENFRRRTMNELEIHKALIKEQLRELLMPTTTVPSRKWRVSISAPRG